MRVRNGRWSLSRGSAVAPRSAAHLLSMASTVPLRHLDRTSPGPRGVLAARSLRSRDPLRVSSAAAHAVMTRFL